VLSLCACAYSQLLMRTSSIRLASIASTVLHGARTGSPASSSGRPSGIAFRIAVFKALSGGSRSSRTRSLRQPSFPRK